ncbi:MAG TPA: primosomal protein N' [Clostridiaceae bacterium]|nr:primosomal protein N' [Clostridiaceae bacterium]
MYAQVWIEEATRGFDRDWSYKIPEELIGKIKPGCLVEVPFARRKQPVRAYVYNVFAERPASAEELDLRSIANLVLPEPVVTSEMLELAREMRRRYFCSRGRAVRTMVPATVSTVGDRKELAARLSDPACVVDMLAEDEFTSLGHIRVCEFLLVHESALLSEIRQACQVSSNVLTYMKNKGILEYFPQKVRRVLEPAPAIELPPQSITLTSEQTEAVESINSALKLTEQGCLKEFLLQGVTGSGKTEIYLQAAAKILSQGKSVLILVPEIALTPLMMARVSERFQDEVAILHSRLTPVERYETWKLILQGERHIVVGARSAVFAPLSDLGLIVVDEEQDHSYKSETTPRYHAVELARIRAILNGAVLVLGSATPSVETSYRALQGRSTKLELPTRVGGAGMAKVSIVDLRRERAAGHKSLFSRPLVKALKDTFSRDEQAMLLINRRGFSTTIICNDCGEILTCPSCDIALTVHKNPWQKETVGNHLICHYCGKVSSLPPDCPSCGGSELDSVGAGTQQAEALFAELFSPAKAVRMDLDTTSGRYSHQEILDAFSRREYDCLIGTQMIAKGHDFHNVTLVGVLSADQILAQSDYRARESAFQLLTQSAGRSGRGELPGQVIIQTSQPDNTVIRTAAEQDFSAFIESELQFRQRAGYPPFGHIGLILISGLKENLVREHAEKLRKHLCAQMERYPASFAQTELLPCQRAPLARLRGRYRYRLIAKSPSKEELTSLLRAADSFKRRTDLTVVLDINPYSML